MTSKDKTNAKERIEFLRQELNRHNYRYYVLNDPEITDFEYDVMMMELAALEKMYPELASPDSPTVKVGSDIAGRPPGSREFRQFRHRWPMLSLGNTYNIEELQDFDRRVREAAGEKFAYSCELKFDGTAICLSYSRGQLVRALTRGDGTVGDDVTDNVRTIPSIPSDIGDVPWDFEIRGGEMHHRRRYDNVMEMELYMYGENISEAEKSTAENIVKANAANFDGKVKKVVFAERAGDFGGEIVC